MKEYNINPLLQGPHTNWVCRCKTDLHLGEKHCHCCSQSKGLYKYYKITTVLHFVRVGVFLQLITINNVHHIGGASENPLKISYVILEQLLSTHCS